MKFKKTILSFIVANLFLINVNAAEVTANNSEVNKKTIAEQNTRELNDTLDSDYLLQYYKEKSGSGRVQIDYQYLIDKPLDMDEVVDLTHPYFNKQLSNMTDEDIDEMINNSMQSEFKGLRNNAIFDEAMKYGIQSALYKVLSDFSVKLEKIAPYYANNFNFNTLMLYNGRVKPPVVIESNSNLEKESDMQLRDIDRSYTFYSQAEVIINTPSFRDYLSFTPIKPEQPNVLLLPLPKKPEELLIWQRGASEGWIQGFRQAYLVINEGLISLSRDYLGMQAYKKLVSAKIATLPVVSKNELTTHSNGKTMNVGESTFIITELPKFNTNSQTWIPLPRVEDIFNNLYLSDKDLMELGDLKDELDLSHN